MSQSQRHRIQLTLGRDHVLKKDVIFRECTCGCVRVRIPDYQDLRLTVYQHRLHQDEERELQSLIG